MSDGEESCGGDPCAVAAELDSRNIELRIHTIGFAADAGTRAQLQCIAEVTGGNYYEARDTEGLRQALRSATAPVTGQIAVVRSDGEIAHGIGFTVVNSAGETVGTVVGSGSFAPGDYSVTVNTEPPLEANVTVVAGEIVTIPLPELGTVRLVNAAGEVQEQFPLTAFAPATNDIIGFGASGTVQLPAGRYDIAVGDMTDQWETVTLAAGETVDIVVDFGAIQLVDVEGNPTDAFPFYIFDVGGVEVFESVNTGFTNLPAGSYDVEVRTDPRLRQTVTVNAGETTNVMLPGLGTLEVVDSNGTPISDYRFQVFPEGSTGQTIYSNDGMVELLAGTYEVEVATNPPTRETVVIESGQTTQIVLPGIGTIQIVDADGNPTTGYAYYVYPEGTDQYVAYSSGRMTQVAEGSYDVEVYTVPRTFQTVTVTAGEITNVQLAGMGTIEIVDAEGNLTDDYAFYVYPEGGNTSVAAGFGSTEIAAGTYDVEVSTSPRSTFTITVNAGETTTIQLGGQGTIQIVDAAGNLADNYAFYVSPEGENNIIATGFGSTEVAAGTYDVEVNTSPVSIFTVTVNAGETAVVQLGGRGTVQLVDTEGNPTDEYAFWVIDPESGDYIDLVADGVIGLNIGEYEIEISTIPPTIYESVSVTADTITEIMLPEIGTLQLVDAQGNPSDEYAFWVIDPESGDYIDLIGRGSGDLVAGTYDIEVTTDPPLRETVTIEAGETTEIQLP